MRFSQEEKVQVILSLLIRPVIIQPHLAQILDISYCYINYVFRPRVHNVSLKVISLSILGLINLKKIIKFQYLLYILSKCINFFNQIKYLLLPQGHQSMFFFYL